MRVILSIVAFFGLVEIAFGIASTYSGYNVTASVRHKDSYSVYAGVPDLLIGGLLCAVGVGVARAMTKRR